MGWQEEISGLYADVAAGRISTEEYRSRRDELLSRPDSAAHAGSAYRASPDPGATEDNPFPPPFRWGGAHRADTATTSDADRTQLVRPGTTPVGPGPGPGPDVDSTQLVRTKPSATTPDADSTQLVRPTTGPAGRDADRTQLVRAGSSAAGPSTPAATPPSRPDGTTPPWHRGDEFTPRPGSDPFGQFRTRGRRSWVKPTVAAVAAVAVVALVVVLVLVRNGSSSSPSTTTTASAPTTQATVIASLPGTQLLDATFATFADLRRAKVLSPEELAGLKPAKPLRTNLRVNLDGQSTTTVWTCAVDGDASSVVSRLTSRSAGAGFVPVSPPYADVAALQRLPAAGKTGPTALRASYVNGAVVVHVETRGPDPAAATAVFRAALDAELASLPAR